MARIERPLLFTPETAIPLTRKQLSTPESRLAAAIIRQAFFDLGLHHNSSDKKDTVKRKTGWKKEAFDWLTDTTSDDWHSLSTQCALISVALGERLDPARIAAAAEAGRRPPRSTRFGGDTRQRRIVRARIVAR